MRTIILDAEIATQLARLLGPLADCAEPTTAMHEFNLGESERDFVDELLIVEPQARKIYWLALRDSAYVPIARSGLVQIGPDELSQRIDWPG